MPHEGDRTKVTELLRDALKDRLANPEEDIETQHLVNDMGLDSLDVVTLLFDIEDRLGVVVPEDDIAPLELLQVSNLVDYVTARTTPGAE